MSGGVELTPLPWERPRHVPQPEPEPEPEPQPQHQPSPPTQPAPQASRWWRAKLSRPCSVCSQTIALGAEIFPTGPTQWAHVSCLAADELVPPICKYFARLGRCAYGEACRYRHAGTAEEVAAAAARPRRGTKGGGSGRAAVSNSCKASVFRRWLIDTFVRASHPPPPLPCNKMLAMGRGASG